MLSENRIAEMRKKRGLSQSALAKTLGVAQNTVSNWENCTREPDIDTLRKLSIFLNCSVGYLLGVEDEQGGIDIGLLQLQIGPQIDLPPNNKNVENMAREKAQQIFFTEKLASIQKSLELLNEIGQKEAVKRVEELTDIPKYRRTDE